MAQNSITELQQWPLKVPACPPCPLLWEGHSLVTEWALAPCVCHLSIPTGIEATGPGKDMDLWPGQSHSSSGNYKQGVSEFLSPETRCTWTQLQDSKKLSTCIRREGWQGLAGRSNTSDHMSPDIKADCFTSSGLELMRPSCPPQSWLPEDDL